MSKLSITFAAIYAATEATLKGLKEPFVKNKNKRAFDSAIDSAEMQVLDAQEALNKELEVVSKGETININNVLKHLEIIENGNKTADTLRELREQFFKD